MPAPPPKGVSSTWPQFNGVDARKSTVSTEWPSASAFSTCRCVRNQSNHCGNSVKTSAFTEEAQVDVDPAPLEVDRADGELLAVALLKADCFDHRGPFR